MGTTNLGALDLYRRTPGPLTPRQLDRVLQVAEAASTVLLRLEPAVEPAVDVDPAQSAYHWSVHQAAGMLTQQLDIPIAEALVMLRATAFSEDRSIDALAADVVERRRRFSKEER